jgi:hypothetical protein
MGMNVHSMYMMNGGTSQIDPRTSWGFLPQIPVGALSQVKLLHRHAEHPGPKDQLVSHRASWGIPPPDPRFLASLGALSLVELTFMERTLLVELHKFGA